MEYRLYHPTGNPNFGTAVLYALSSTIDMGPDENSTTGYLNTLYLNLKLVGPTFINRRQLKKFTCNPISKIVYTDGDDNHLMEYSGVFLKLYSELVSSNVPDYYYNNGDPSLGFEQTGDTICKLLLKLPLTDEVRTAGTLKVTVYFNSCSMQGTTLDTVCLYGCYSEDNSYTTDSKFLNYSTAEAATSYTVSIPYTQGLSDIHWLVNPAFAHISNPPHTVNILYNGEQITPTVANCGLTNICQYHKYGKVMKELNMFTLPDWLKSIPHDENDQIEFQLTTDHPFSAVEVYVIDSSFN